MSSLLLSQDEVEELTGKVKYTAQAAALRSMGIECRPRPGMCPAVSRNHAEEVLSGGVGMAKKDAAEPNWGAMQ